MSTATNTPEDTTVFLPLTHHSDVRVDLFDGFVMAGVVRGDRREDVTVDWGTFPDLDTVARLVADLATV